MIIYKIINNHKEAIDNQVSTLELNKEQGKLSIMCEIVEFSLLFSSLGKTGKKDKKLKINYKELYFELYDIAALVYYGELNKYTVDDYLITVQYGYDIIINYYIKEKIDFNKVRNDGK